MNANNAVPTTTIEYVPAQTRVVSTNDGESGLVLNGYASNSAGWSQYEVVTRFGIEIWDRAEFLTEAEINDALKDG